MKQRFKRLGAALMALALTLTLLPAVTLTASAADRSVDISDYANGSAISTAIQAAIDAAASGGGTVTVTGTKYLYGVDYYNNIQLDIPKGVTVRWAATLDGGGNSTLTHLVYLLNVPEGTGSFEVVSGGSTSAGIIRALYSGGPALTVSGGKVEGSANAIGVNSTSLTVSGGEVVKKDSSLGYAVCLQGSSQATVTGGSVRCDSANGGTYAIFGDISTVSIAVSGGEVINKGTDGTAIATGGDATDLVTISGGMVLAAGTNGNALNSSGVTVTGGSVGPKITGSTSVKNAQGTQIYPVTLTGLPASKAVSAISSPSGHGLKDVKTDANGQLYLFAPVGKADFILTVDGTSYCGRVYPQTSGGNTLAMAAGSSIADNRIGVITQPAGKSVNYGTGTSLSVTAAAENNAAVSYQWYSNAANSNIGGVAIEGATASELVIPAGKPAGTYYYYCVLKAASLSDVSTNVAAVTVRKAKYTGITKDTVIVPAETAQAEVTYSLPALPDEMMWGTPSAAGDLASSPQISGGTLSFSVTAQPAGTSSVITVPINGGNNYDSSSLKLTVAAIRDVSAYITFADPASRAYDPGAAYAPQGASVGGDGFTAGDDPAWSYTYAVKGIADNGNAKLDADGKPLSAGTYTVTAAYSDSINTGSKTATLVITPKPLADSMLGAITAQTYDGMQLTPSITVTDGEALTEGTDYIVSYGENKNAAADGGTVTVTGKGNYAGAQTSSFTVLPITLTITGGTVAEKIYDGTTTAPVSGITFGGLLSSQLMTQGTDYTVTQANFDSASAVSGKTVTATVTLIADGPVAKNYTLESGALTLSDQAIARRPVTVKADHKSMIRGGALPTFTYTVDGQLAGETALSGSAPDLSCAADGATAGGFDITIDLTGVTYTANYTAASPASANGTLTVSNSIPIRGGGPTTTTPTPTVSGSTATTTVTPTITNGTASSTVTAAQVTNAIEKAKEAAKTTGGTAAVEIKAETGTAITSKTTIPQTAMSALASGVGALSVTSSLATVSFDAAALKTISGAATGSVTVSASQVDVSALPAAAQALVGSRPVFEFSVTSGGNTISQFNGTATLAVPYTLGAGENPNAVIVSYINASGNLETVMNGRYDAATGTVIFTTTHFSRYAVGYNKVSFADVAGSAWYADAVTYLSARGVTGGTSHTTFSPDATLTRGQFITLLLRAYGVAADKTPADNFSDAGDTYYTGYLAAAKRLGISNGVGDNKFAPEKAITRQEMFTLLYNALKVLNKLPQGSSGKALSDFIDGGSVAAYAQMAMAYLVEASVVFGNNGKLDPTATSTRAQMAQVLYNLLSK